MSIEKEIDEIFLHKASKTSDGLKIKHLQEYSEKLEEVKPYLSILAEQIGAIKTPFEIYNIQLEALAKDLELIQEKNKELEEKLTKDQKIFEKLKDLVLALNIDEAHLQVLDNGNFGKMSDLTKMQEALAILSGFDVEKYKLRIVLDVKQKVLFCQKNFYKRFVNFLNKTFVETESKGELKVHKDLYTKIKQYEFIFNRSKQFQDCFDIVFGAYIMHSKKLYEGEFIGHLKTIDTLVDDDEKLHVAIEILFKSYKSIVMCERNFINNLIDDSEIADKGIQDIFKNVSAVLFEFTDKMFKKSRMSTIIAISEINKEEEDTEVIDFIKGFNKECKTKFQMLQDFFMKDEELNIKKTYNVRGLMTVFKQENLLDLKLKMFKLYIERIQNRMENYSLFKLVDRYKLMTAIKIPVSLCTKELKCDETKEYVCKELSIRIEKKIIGEVLSGENSKENVKKLIEKIKQDKDTYIEGERLLIHLTREIVMEHVDSKEKFAYAKLFEN